MNEQIKDQQDDCLDPKNDPILKLLDFNAEEATREELSSFIANLHKVLNDPVENRRLFRGVTAKKKTSSTSKEKALLEGILDNL